MFILRKSPFHADRNHIHHKLLDLGLSHQRATLLLAGVNVAIILGTYWLNAHVRASILLGILILTAVVLSQVPNWLLREKNRKRA